MEKDLIFSNFTYSKLNQAYNNALSPQVDECCFLLSNLISNLETGGFKMDLKHQNSILNQLNQAKQILNILFKSTTRTTSKIPNNPFSLIQQLSILSTMLTTHNIKSPLQTIQLKVNNIILNCIYEISEYFILKLFKN